MGETEERLNVIVSKLEEGILIPDGDLEFLSKWNELGIGERLLGEKERSSDVQDLLSSIGKQALDLAIAVSDDSNNYDLKLGGRGDVLGEPFFGGLRSGPKVVSRGAELLRSGSGAAPKVEAGQEVAKRSFRKWVRSHPKTSLGVGAATLWGSYQKATELFSTGELSDTEQAVQTATAPDEGIAPQLPQGLILVDPVTGQEIDPATIDPAFAATSEVRDSFGNTVAFGSDITALAASAGVDMSTLGFEAMQSVNPNILGEVSVNPSQYPSGIDVYGNPIKSAERFVNTRQDMRSDFLQEFLPEEDYNAGLAFGVSAPPGAQLNPAFFGVIEAPEFTTTGRAADTRRDRIDRFGSRPDRFTDTRQTIQSKAGRTLSTEAAAAAGEFDVPIDILYGVINSTSGWNPQAVGNGGATYGLGQITSDIMSRTAAQNPRTALRYVARDLSNGYDEYGAWELAALNFHDGDAAFQLMNDGTIDKVNKSWLTDTLSSSAKSGLGNNIFDFAGLAATPARRSGGGASSGPKIPAFQEPDRALLRENARRAVESVYGRTTEGDELSEFVEQLMSGYKEAYEQEVIRIKGGTSVQVDPQAGLLDELRTSGEGKFRVERDQTRSMMDRVGEWSRILQEA